MGSVQIDPLTPGAKPVLNTPGRSHTGRSSGFPSRYRTVPGSVRYRAGGNDVTAGPRIHVVTSSMTSNPGQSRATRRTVKRMGLGSRIQLATTRYPLMTKKVETAAEPKLIGTPRTCQVGSGKPAATAKECGKITMRPPKIGTRARPP